MHILKKLTGSLIFRIIVLGIIIRLVMMVFFNHFFDYFNILALVKSVADTGNLTEGFFVLKRQGIEAQLYGKMFYQIAAAWMLLLDKLSVVNIDMFFDVKPYQSGTAYMATFGNWTPPLSQLIPLKFVQFIYDFLLLYFIYKIADIVNPQKKYLAVLLWALNPYLIFVTYAMFQSDLAMMAFLMGGIYFTMKGLKDNGERSFSRSTLLALSCFAIGAVIKQVPILFAPFAILLFAKNIRSFFIHVAWFLISYAIVGQSWAADTTLMKQFFMDSKESLAVFKYQLNGVSVFIFSYFVLLSVFCFQLKKFRETPTYVLHLAAIIMIIIYLGEDSNYLFPQFNTWIMPILGLLMLLNPIYSLFLSAPIIGFLKRTLIDNHFFTAALAVTLGNALAEVPKYSSLLKNITNPTLIEYLMQTGMIFMYFLLLILLVCDLGFLSHLKIQEKLSFVRQKINIVVIILILFSSYVVMLGIDYTIKSSYVLLTSTKYEEFNNEVKMINRRKLVMNIDNPSRLTITSFDIKAKRTQIYANDFVVFKFIDRTNNQTILEQKVHDYNWPQLEDVVTVYLKKGITNEKIRLEVFKESNANEVIFYEGKKIPNTKPVGQEKFIDFAYQGTGFQIKFRGKFDITERFNKALNRLQSIFH